ncbi:lipopolysaccharide biosynthesis protein [[Eubacterium] hominis]|uniref:lipopolysaccharide biosynthesis protein n=1 Tax=[Eubacterium] hominis TaxID=2764325 RepID=UPI003A4E4A36
MKNNIIKGSFFGVAYQIIVVIFSFTLRTVLIKELGNEYVALVTVFTSIFGVLACLDGGMGSALFIRIHPPLWNENYEEVKRLYNLIRVVYLIRAILMVVVGIMIIPFLDVFVGDVSISHKTVLFLYIIFMILNCSSTAYIYKVFMVETIQFRYKTIVFQILISIISYTINIISLIIWKNIYMYLLLLLIIPITVNIYCHRIISKQLPYLINVKLSFKNLNKKELLDMAKLSLHSMSDIVVLNSDNLIVSSTVSFNSLAIYSNFRMITTNVQNLVMQVLFSIKDPIRKIMCTSSQDEVDKLQYLILNIYCIIANFVCISLIVMLNPFVGIWLGDSYILDNATIILINFCLFLTIIGYPILDAYYFEECYKTDYRTPIVEILINIFASIGFAYLLGLPGVFVGTMLYNIYKLWKRSYVYYKNVGKSNNLYFKKVFILIIYFSINILIAILFSYLIEKIDLNIYMIFLIKLILCLILPNLLSLLIFRKDICYLMELIRK